MNSDYTKKSEVACYPSIDRPWLKYYTDSARNAKMPQLTMYKYIYNINRNFPKDIALEFYGRKISYKDFFVMVDHCAESLYSLGIKKGDIVTVQSITIPQVIVLIYALNKIGACGNMIYPDVKPLEIYRTIVETNSKAFFVLENIYSSYESEIKCKLCENIIVMKVSDEMNAIAQIVSSAKNKCQIKSKNGLISWKSFMRNRGQQVVENTDPFLPAFMVYTGGSTGKPKAVVLSSYGINSVVEQYKLTDIELIRGKTNLNVLPPFIAFGINIGIHLPISTGIKTVISLSSSSEDAYKSFYKYKPNYYITGAAYLENIINNCHHDIDLSFVNVIAMGGDFLSLSQEKRINLFLEKHHSHVKLIKGYGMSETSGTTITETSSCHKAGTVGIPLPLVNVKIVDSDTNVELPLGYEGELCISTPSTMVGYYKIDSNETIEPHNDGVKWVHTGDVATLDENVYVTIIGRIKRIITVIYKGTYHKVFPKILEEKFQSIRGLSEIVIVGRNCPDTQNELVAFIVPDPNIQNSMFEDVLRNYAENNLEIYERPVEYRFVNDLPKTLIGKIDFRAIEKAAEIDFDELNR